MNHPWDLDVKAAKALQASLAEKVILEDRFGPVRFLGGTDVGFEDQGKTTRAAVVVLEWPGLKLVDYAIARMPTRFPYIPGLLSFRELPTVLEALEKLKTQPDLVLCDGAGIAHPRGLGIASHLGVISGLATIGVAKSRLWGRHQELGLEQGDREPLVHNSKVIGTVLRSRSGVKPLYISAGHKISLETAVDWVIACLGRYRLPETTRWADKLASGKGKAASDLLAGDLLTKNQG